MRLSALSAPSGQSLSRQEHDSITEIKLVRRRTLAAQRSENQPQSPPWDGTSFPTTAEAQAAVPAIRDGKAVLDLIRKNSLDPPRFDPPQSSFQPPPPPPPLGESPPLAQFKRYTLSDTVSPPPPGPNRTSPARKLRKNAEHNNSSTSIASSAPARFVGGADASAGRAPSPGRNPRMRVTSDDMGSIPTPPGSEPYVAPSANDDGSCIPLPATTSGPSKHPTTFAEMGFHGAKAEAKDCIIM